VPRLSKATTAELVKLLEHPNGWHRDTASRLLYQKQDASAVPLLRAFLKTTKSGLGVVHALYALDGLKSLDAKDVLPALDHADGHVRSHGLKLSERFASDVAVRARMLKLANDAELSVRFQLAFSLAAVEGGAATKTLHQLARADSKDQWMRLAILTSAHGRRGEFFQLIVNDDKFRPSMEGKLLTSALAVQIGAANQANELGDFLNAMDRLPATDGRELMASLMSKLPSKSRDRIKSAGKSGDLFKQLVSDALTISRDEKQSVVDRVAAVRTLGLADFANVKMNFVEFLKFRQPEAVQKAALETLTRFEQTDAAGIVIDAWPSLSPQVRATAAETLFARGQSIQTFLDAVENGKIKTGEIDPARIKLLQTFADAKIRSRAEKLFKGTQLSQRKDVVAAYQKSLDLKGDAPKGKEIFKKNCAACHRIDGVGEQIGAELGAIKDRGPEFILLNVLDPNREVLPKFITYVATTDVGLTVTGMITAETATSITVRRPDGTSTTILRINIDELRSTGMSFMPEGLEKSINHQEMADLIAFLMSAK
jgi:putative heme-binding domain-containing protein